ncbi:hypothetical protein HDU93_002936 [Gonapodya sp. JEL0774]|nr:hypothetical protein HDU93_002936 [Gonapodya sp. JEL0774]
MPSSRVYVGRLPRDTTERDLDRLFRDYGRVREINVKAGFAFIEFDDPRDAHDAVKQLDGVRFLGERIMVEPARGERRREVSPRREKRFAPPSRSSYRIVIENLSPSVSWQDLKDHFRRAGEVTFADAHKEKEGVGFVEFSHPDDMREAIRKFHDTEFKGRIISIQEDNTPSADRDRNRDAPRSSRDDDRRNGRRDDGRDRRSDRDRDGPRSARDDDRERRDSRDDDRVRRDSRDNGDRRGSGRDDDEPRKRSLERDDRDMDRDRDERKGSLDDRGDD